jgi:hypothetical protein
MELKDEAFLRKSLGRTAQDLDAGALTEGVT